MCNTDKWQYLLLSTATYCHITGKPSERKRLEELIQHVKIHVIQHHSKAVK